MRDVKFRFWDKEDKEMEECVQIDLPNKTEHANIVAMQYTGLKDTKGLEIYEGDILEASLSYKGGVLPTQGEVVFNKRFAAFALKNEGGETLFHCHVIDSFRVIGNIYESVESIEENKDNE